MKSKKNIKKLQNKKYKKTRKNNKTRKPKKKYNKTKRGGKVANNELNSGLYLDKFDTQSPEIERLTDNLKSGLLNLDTTQSPEIEIINNLTSWSPTDLPGGHINKNIIWYMFLL